jgi:hypothetical protein
MFSESTTDGFAKGAHSGEKDSSADRSLKEPEFRVSPEWHKAPLFDTN